MPGIVPSRQGEDCCPVCGGDSNEYPCTCPYPAKRKAVESKPKLEPKSYLFFRFAGFSPSGKTKRVEVWNKAQDNLLGYISWYGGWRRYVYHPSSQILMDKNCLQEIVTYLDDLMKDYNYSNK